MVLSLYLYLYIYLHIYISIYIDRYTYIQAYLVNLCAANFILIYILSAINHFICIGFVLFWASPNWENSIHQTQMAAVWHFQPSTHYEILHPLMWKRFTYLPIQWLSDMLFKLLLIWVMFIKVQSQIHLPAVKTLKIGLSKSTDEQKPIFQYFTCCQVFLRLYTCCNRM